jgi:hypothetical protein
MAEWIGSFSEVFECRLSDVPAPGGTYDRPIKGQSLVAFAASVFETRTFADAEIAEPRPDINSRILATVHAGQSVLANRSEVAAANAGTGLDVGVLCGHWQDEVLDSAQVNEVRRLFPRTSPNGSAAIEFAPFAMKRHRSRKQHLLNPLKETRGGCGNGQSIGVPLPSWVGRANLAVYALQ